MTKSEIIKSMLKLAKSDLKSSTILYEKGLFPQSIYFFQQAVEKSNKALVIYADFFTLSDIKKVNHSQSKLVKGALKIQFAEIARVVEAKDYIPNFLQLLKEFNFDLGAYAALLAQTDDGIQWINDQTELRNLSTVRLQQILNMVKAWDTTMKGMKKGPMFLAVQEFLPPYLDTLRQTEVANVASVAISEAVETLDSKELAKMLGIVIIKAIDFSRAVIPVHVLGFVFDKLESKVRYPTISEQDILDPTTVFNGRLPLVKKLPEFHRQLRQALRTFEKTMIF